MIDRGILDRLGEARNQKAFGGGMASNVVRFDLRQKATRTASPIFETKQQKAETETITTNRTLHFMRE